MNGKSKFPPFFFQLGTAPVDKHRENYAAQTLRDVKDRLLRKKIGHRQIPFYQAVARLQRLPAPLPLAQAFIRQIEVVQRDCQT